MHESSSDLERLNPRRFIDHLKHIVSSGETALDEVFVRRAISALFFSLFNYWAIKSYARGKRGNAPLGIVFPLSAFFEDLLRSGLDYAIYPLFVYRVGADHYALNPATVALISKPWKGRQESINISYSVLEGLIELSYDILDYFRTLLANIKNKAQLYPLWNIASHGCIHFYASSMLGQSDTPVFCIILARGRSDS